MHRYADANPLLCAKLVSLEDDFPATRRVGGDGNCFYRAALFALLEAVLTAPDPGLGDRCGRVYRCATDLLLGSRACSPWMHFTLRLHVYYTGTGA